MKKNFEIIVEHKFVAIVILAIVLIGGGTVYTMLKPDTITIQELSYLESINRRYEVDYQPRRDSYGKGLYRGAEFEINDIFAKLPPVPEYFYAVKEGLLNKKIKGEHICNITKEYYLQPEFYKDNFVNVGLQTFYANPDPNRGGTMGYATYPHEMNWATKPGKSTTVCTTFRSTWGAEPYQGIGLKVVYPKEGSYNGEVVQANATETRKYIKVNLFPNEVLLEPAYVQFEPGWAQMIKVQIEVSPDTPEGYYIIGFDVTSISEETNSKYRAQIDLIAQEQLKRIKAREAEGMVDRFVRKAGNFFTGQNEEIFVNPTYTGLSSTRINVPQFIEVIKV